MSSGSDEPLFIIRPPQGRAYVIWADGTTSGFPDGSVVVNRIGCARTGVAHTKPSLLQRVQVLCRGLFERRERGERS